MFRTMMRGLARVTMFLVAAAFLTVASLFVLGSYFATWPILRMSPRDARIKAAVDAVTAGMTLLSTFRKDDADA